MRTLIIDRISGFDAINARDEYDHLNVTADVVQQEMFLKSDSTPKKKGKKRHTEVLSSVLSSQMQVSFSLGCQNQILSFSSLSASGEMKVLVCEGFVALLSSLKKERKKKNPQHTPC